MQRKQVNPDVAMKNGIPMIGKSMAGHYSQSGLGQLKKIALLSAPAHMNRSEKKRWLKAQHKR